MKLWGGRFAKETSHATDDFNSSISFDCRLYRQDIDGSIAHATMLGKQGIISVQDADAIVAGLKSILVEIESGGVEFDVAAEDIHMNIEKLLIERIGEVGKRLHTGRSRNDQVALDLRLYLYEAAYKISNELKNMKNIILKLAEGNLDAIMPGYTHLQRAQPILFSHHMMAYYEMFSRDYDRLSDCSGRINISPLGSGALAGTTFPLDRDYVAASLGMTGVTRNSLDGVSDRDFAVELAFVCSMVMMHLSRFSEEIILWSSQEFAFVLLDDAFSTGSSIMPQKKNPDIAELTRGKTGRVYGDLIALLTMMKGLPLAYNKDMQEDKEQVFDAVDTVLACLPIFGQMLETMKLNKENMRRAALGGFTNATDAADYLVKKGLPFRDAHAIIGRMVATGKPLEEWTLSELGHPFEQDFYHAVALETCVNQRQVCGGTAIDMVKKAIEEAKRQ